MSGHVGREEKLDGAASLRDRGKGGKVKECQCRVTKAKNKHQLSNNSYGLAQSACSATNWDLRSPRRI